MKSVLNRKDYYAALVELLEQNPEEQRQQALTSIQCFIKKTKKLKIDKVAIAYHACTSTRMDYTAHRSE